MNNLLSYCGLVDARIRASEKDLPVHTLTFLVSLKADLCAVHVFYPDFIQILSRFYLDFLETHFILISSRFYPNFVHILF